MERNPGRCSHGFKLINMSYAPSWSIDDMMQGDVYDRCVGTRNRSYCLYKINVANSAYLYVLQCH